MPDEAWCPRILVACTELSSLGSGGWGRWGSLAVRFRPISWPGAGCGHEGREGAVVWGGLEMDV